MMNHLLTNETCAKKLNLKNSWKVPDLCPTESPSRNLNRENLNLKNAMFATQKSSIMMIEPR
jgi:hypothetical protein